MYTKESFDVGSARHRTEPLHVPGPARPARPAAQSNRLREMGVLRRVS